MSTSRRYRSVRRFGVLPSFAALAAASIMTTVGAGADPNAPAPPLPVFTATPTNWGPNLSRWHSDRITEADITAERELCEWFNAQFGTLVDQITTFNSTLAANHDDYTAPSVQQHADAVTANIDQSEAFVVPRAEAIQESRRCRSDDSGVSCRRETNIYGGDSFKNIANQLGDVGNGFKNHNPAFIDNVSIGLANANADKIRGEGICA